MLRRVALLGVVASVLAAGSASAQEEQPVVAGQVDLTHDQKPAATEDLLAPPRDSYEAPPTAPYKKSVVLDSSIGVLGFLGKFGKVAPPGPLMRLQLGYELFRWLMVFGEGELAFTDTSNRQQPPDTRSFPLFGFGGGARATVKPTRRLGLYVQGELGALAADIKTNALGILGFRDAESLGFMVGGHAGVEWYQVDRHFALGLNFGVRLPTNFSPTAGGSALALDGGAAIRYAF
jgi:hypothetical protein